LVASTASLLEQQNNKTESSKKKGTINKVITELLRSDRLIVLACFQKKMSDIELELKSYLKTTRILSAWHTFLLELLESGAPNENVYDYAANCLLKYRDEHKDIKTSDVKKRNSLDDENSTQLSSGMKKSFPGTTNDKHKSPHQHNQISFIKERFEASINSDSGLGKPVFSSKNIIHDLKDGFLLCTFVNSHQPNQIQHIHSENPTEPEKVENISNFLEACNSVGVLSQTQFSPRDLIEERNTKKVIQCIISYIIELEKQGLVPKTENITNTSNLLHSSSEETD